MTHPETHERPGGLIPYLVCDPCSEAIEFYKKAFGANERFRLATEPGDKFMHVEMTPIFAPTWRITLRSSSRVIRYTYQEG